MKKEYIKFIGSIQHLRFSASDSLFKIATMRVSQVLEGDLHKDRYGNVIFKGEMSMIPQNNYIITGEYVEDKKYGPQYKFVQSQRENPVEDMSAEDFRRFLIDLSAKAVDINKVYPDSREIFQKNDVDALTKIKGIGVKTALDLFEKYENQKDYGPAYVAFGKWGFTQEMTRKICAAKGSMEVAVETLKKNPYDFMGISGIGFKTIDKRATKFGIANNDSRRVNAFVTDYFEKIAMDGNSWISPSELKEYLEQEIYDCDANKVFEWIKNSRKFVTLSVDDVTRIALKEYVNAEEIAAKHLLSLKHAVSKFKLNDENKTIEELEKNQGWEYSDEQRKAIHTMLHKNVTLLQGPGGVGKTSTLNAVIKVLQANGYKIANCALSGKAADNLTQLTGLRGKTIHRLLGIAAEGIVTFNSRTPLPYDVIILDELSMVNVKLFSMLVQAIKPGSKFIMVGDVAQLDSIGVGVMRDIMKSKVIDVISLSQIHRQAQNSAITMHSLTYRKGEMTNVTEEQSWHRLGKNKDLGYVFESANEEEKLFKDTYMVYRQMLKSYSIPDIQILTPMTYNCLRINKHVQNIANPSMPSSNEYTLYPGKDYGYTLREGDKVLNTANNYYTVSADNPDVTCPIFNGNTGVIEKISVCHDKDGNTTSLNMIINFYGVGRVAIDENGVKNIKLGYAMTVHKSQGSTIPCVIIALPFQYMLNSRELLYTAITRASKECYLLTSMKTLRATVAKTSGKKHQSNLCDFLREEEKKDAVS